MLINHFNEVPWTPFEGVVFVMQLIACVAATAFPLFFALRAPWWVSALGRAQLLSSAVLAVSLWLSAAFRLLRHADIYVTEYTGLWIAFFVFFSIAVAKTCLTLVMLRIQRDGQGYSKDDPEPL